MTISDEFEARRQTSLAPSRSHPDQLPRSITRMASPNYWRGVHDLLAEYERWRREVLRTNEFVVGARLIMTEDTMAQRFVDYMERQ